MPANSVEHVSSPLSKILDDLTPRAARADNEHTARRKVRWPRVTVGCNLMNRRRKRSAVGWNERKLIRPGIDVHHLEGALLLCADLKGAELPDELRYEEVTATPQRIGAAIFMA